MEFSTWTARGDAQFRRGRLDEAAESCLRAIGLAPHRPEGYGNLGCVLLAQGKPAEAMAAHEQALAVDPTNLAAYRGLMLAALYRNDLSADEDFDLLRRFEEVMARPLYPLHPDWAVEPEPDRRLRIGYLSSDWGAHPVGRNLLPVIQSHDRSRVELYLYADIRAPDAVTDHFRELADAWRPVTGLSDKAVAGMIRADAVDVLVVLAGRFDGNRPLVAAYRPAPVQISLHDPATSGLSVMDALITDPVLTPRHGAERFAERPIRLPHFYVHPALAPSPDVTEPPLLRCDVPTFGSFSNPAKLSDGTLRLWAELLRRVPGSRLRLKYKNLFASPSVAERVLRVMAAAGVAAERIDLSGDDQPVLDHLGLYGEIDVALDPFPFCGSTTTFEALWMGVPVVTLPTGAMVGRWTAAMLDAVGLSHLVARSEEHYLEICIRLVADAGALADLRRGLRERVLASSLCDGRGRARQLERVYGALWRRWLAGGSSAPRPGLVAQGIELARAGRMDEAEHCFQRALAADPDNGEALNNYATLLNLLGRLEDAVEVFRRAVAAAPDAPLPRRNLAATLCTLGTRDLNQSRVEAAEGWYRQAFDVAPDLPDASYNLGVACLERGRLAEAADWLLRALELEPDHGRAALNLGTALVGLRRFDQARAVLERHLADHPDDAGLILTLGNAALGQGHFDEAAALYQRVLEIDPGQTKAVNNLGNALQTLGRFDESVGCYQSALEARPDDISAHRGLLTSILYDARWSQQALFAEHRRFEEMHASRHYPAVPMFRNPRDPDKRLRIGYLSSDLRDHPVARNFLPWVEKQDRNQFDLYFYAEVVAPDAMTERFRHLADGWRWTVGRSDAEVAGMIRDDGIDVLVILAGRFDGNRPLVAAFRPAPIQVTWGDVATSGLAVMDAILTDRVMTPRNGAELFTERPIRLPTFYVHAPLDGAPDPGPPPMLAKGYPTFASFSNPAKLGDETLRLWAAALRGVPGSRLWLKYRNQFASPSLAQRVLSVMEREGIDPARLNLAGEEVDAFHHLALYRGVDVALDTMPFNGSTTTFEALWMGVPVVTLLGSTMVSRWTASMLRPLGLSHLAAGNEGEFVEICARLAADPQGLAELRASLRQKVAGSALCDTRARARQIDRVLRALWRRWCLRGESR
ncbi:hypothetical protein A6A04_12180 [Paramagnetospirillum marisnigri]|uniref:protein O-GlcNAc transferase n=1 Tax=Paramagnetospirillum marisnigri TaxID=1285242 RepID=A0A178MVV8_9PROT|nr:tetratricopeptide repeat protein [Paramagnetospirillum marisnigri]OAN54675.1 hypothetical protein A6A04_12180 [Paramagnetospirillum marisnigri]